MPLATRRTALLGALSLPLPALAQGGAPPRSVTLVVPYAAGGATDILGRILAQGLQEKLGGSFIVENRPGAATAIGARAVARARPADGHMLLVRTNVTFTVNPALLPDLGYDPLADFAHLTLLAETPYVLVVNPARGPASLAAFLERAKARPGALSYGSFGNGSMAHLAAEIFSERAGVTMTHVPYRGSGQAVPDLLAGNIDLMFDTVASAKPLIQSGQLRALGVTAANRLPALPDVPSFAEQGLSGVVVTGWFSVSATAGTPAPVIASLAATAAEVFAAPAARQRLDSLSLSAPEMGPAAMQRQIATETPLYGALIRRLNIRAE
ncbi:tripartite tricarboxylate transporter substrate binding protein [Roseococcus sp. SDR]|uniref:Bug family tripartite tricarboxylate transporter substrate binding protein n=1 Tax=Roseococcus sp. SDR TaxID=2835532 RepID=UPI001BD0753D|nr:tripartite tricarboxylate transporter substrate-binding protein [Roseococcus sp. SDR]MBS7792489.1 tripartite tricarboxylate transporter substrate binding protein [Roseococcus sp. SDR]MBV1847803.1 tripartite tricarboxylate transporter substrate binding protein [Roseococcus sp. SDR]